MGMVMGNGVVQLRIVKVRGNLYSVCIANDYNISYTVIRCQDVADPYDGQIEFQPDRLAPFDYGTRAVYTCKGGYSLRASESERVCGGDGLSTEGVWSGEDYICLLDGN